MNYWIEFIKTLELTGAAKELVSASTIDGCAGEIYLRLKVDPAYKILVTPTVINKIATALEKQLAIKVHLEIELREENAVVIGYNINRPEGLQ